MSEIASISCFGTYQLPAGRALRLMPRKAATLKIICGSAWITLESQSGDHVVLPGQCITAQPGDRLVMESLRATEGLRFDWQPVAAPARQRSTLRASPAQPALACGVNAAA